MERKRLYQNIIERLICFPPRLLWDVSSPGRCWHSTKTNGWWWNWQGKSEANNWHFIFCRRFVPSLLSCSSYPCGKELFSNMAHSSVTSIKCRNENPDISFHARNKSAFSMLENARLSFWHAWTKPSNNIGSKTCCKQTLILLMKGILHPAPVGRVNILKSWTCPIMYKVLFIPGASPDFFHQQYTFHTQNGHITTASPGGFTWGTADCVLERSLPRHKGIPLHLAFIEFQDLQLWRPLKIYMKHNNHGGLKIWKIIFLSKWVMAVGSSR